MTSRTVHGTQSGVAPRTLLVRAGRNVFWTNPATGVVSEFSDYVSDWPMACDDGAPIAPSSVSPPNEGASSSPAACEGHLWIG